MSLLGALGDIGEAARLDGRPLPVIRTDIRTARLLGLAIERELGGRLGPMPAGVVAMFDGIEIRGDQTMSNTAGSTNDDKRHFPLRIERLQDGGFVVSDAPSYPDDGREKFRLFASTSIGEALAFIAGRLDPEAFKALQDQQAKAAAAADASSSARIRRGAPVSPADEKSRGSGAIVGGDYDEAARNLAKSREGMWKSSPEDCGRGPDD